MAPIRRILLIQIRYLGDVLLTTPTIRAARQAFPSARIDYLVGEAASPALRDNPYLDEVIIWRRGLRNDMRLLWKLFRRRYDAVIDMHSRPRSAVQVLAAGGRIRVGIRFNEFRDRFYTHLYPREEVGVYMARKKLELLGALGVTAPADTDVSLDLSITADDRAWARATVGALGIGERDVIVALSPVTRSHHKQWGIEKWAAVGDALASAGARVLITSGPGELEQAGAVAQRMRHPAIYEYGATTVHQLAALYEHCSLWVGNDGGSKHVATAAGTPTVSVGRWITGPIWSDLTPGSRQRAIEREPVLPCDFNCGHCAHLSCLEQVSTHDVVALVREALGETLQRAPARVGT